MGSRLKRGVGIVAAAGLGVLGVFVVASTAAPSSPQAAGTRLSMRAATDAASRQAPTLPATTSNTASTSTTLKAPTTAAPVRPTQRADATAPTGPSPTTTVAPASSPFTAAAPGTLLDTILPAEPPTAPGQATYLGIVVLNPDGSGRRILASGNYYDPLWTPDGRFVVFQDDTTNAILSVPYQGGTVTQLGVGRSAAVSPDGTRLAYGALGLSGGVPGEIVVQPIATTPSGLEDRGSPTEATDPAVDISWSPNGEDLLYGRVITGSALGAPATGHIIIRPVAGGDPVDLLAGAPVEANLAQVPRFSPDGSTVSFTPCCGSGRRVSAPI